MAEGGETTTSFENPAFDPRGGDYDDYEEFADETTPFFHPLLLLQLVGKK